MEARRKRLCLTSQMIGFIENEGTDASIIFRECRPLHRSERQGDFCSRFWPVAKWSESVAELETSCVFADFAQLRADLDADFRRLLERIGNK